MNPADRTDPAVAAALTRRCGLCNAKPGEDCRNLTKIPHLYGRIVHWYRIIERPNPC